MIMTTITLKINENTKAGKAFLEMTNVLIKDSKGIELVHEPLSPKQKALINRLKKIKEDANSGVSDKIRPIQELLNEI